MVGPTDHFLSIVLGVFIFSGISSIRSAIDCDSFMLSRKSLLSTTYLSSILEYIEAISLSVTITLLFGFLIKMGLPDFLLIFISSLFSANSVEGLTNTGVKGVSFLLSTSLVSDSLNGWLVTGIVSLLRKNKPAVITAANITATPLSLFQSAIGGLAVLPFNEPSILFQTRLFG